MSVTTASRKSSIADIYIYIYIYTYIHIYIYTYTYTHEQSIPSA